MFTLRRCVPAVLLLCALLVAPWLRPPAAWAAPVDANEQARVRIDMTKDEVRAAIGAPARQRHIGRTGQDVWRYPTTPMETWFEIIFNKDGKVTSATPVWVPPF